jgi:hypothetical protein
MDESRNAQIRKDKRVDWEMRRPVGEVCAVGTHLHSDL